MLQLFLVEPVSNNMEFHNCQMPSSINDKTQQLKSKTIHHDFHYAQLRQKGTLRVTTTKSLYHNTLKQDEKMVAFIPVTAFSTRLEAARQKVTQARNISTKPHHIEMI